MSLKDSFLLWRDYFRGKYPNIEFRNLMSINRHWPNDVEYNKNYDNLFRKIIENGKHITEFKKCDGMIDRFYIYFENGNYIEFMVGSSISTFIDNIELYNKDGKRLFKFEKGKPKKSTFVEFLDVFNNFLYIKEGLIIYTQESVITDFIDFFNFDEKKDDEESE